MRAERDAANSGGGIGTASKAGGMAMSVKPRIGFIGLGNMGRPMTERLIAAGHELAVFDTDPRRILELGRHALLPAGLTELGAMSEFVITMLPDGKIVRRGLCEGENCVLKGLAPGAPPIDLSSPAPRGTR